MGGIRDRIEDAELLRRNDRLQGAFLVALCAVAAVAQRRYPNLKDRERFEMFLRDSSLSKIKVEYRGELHPIEHIFYKWMRCELVHEGGLPDNIQLVMESEDNVRSIRAGGAPDFVMHVGLGWFDFIINIVKRTREYTHV